MSVLSAVWERLENPVAFKEMRSRMRGGRAFTILAVYVGILCAALMLILSVAWNEYSRDMTVQAAAEIGRGTFMTLALVQLALVALMAPAFTSGTITLEREQLTLDLLRLTRLTSRDILWGKLLSSLSYLGILIAASVPVASLCFLMGGVSPEEMLAVYALTASVALLMGTIGLFFSTVSRKTSAAGAVSYGTVFILLLGTPVYGYFVESMIRDYYNQSQAVVKVYAEEHYFLLVGLCTLVVAAGGAILLGWAARGIGLRWPRALGVPAFLLALVGLGFYVAKPLMTTSAYYPSDMSVTLASHPFMIMAIVIMGFGRYGPWPSPLFSDYTWYWVGAVILYLSAAACLLALTVRLFERSRARA